ncbi:hypothetical protein niasHT_018221 [Heterodera trifolii]|uniref:PHD-type domain-containing protein n=1 Tax=Heterodera trifolii TaxID=157864 RepID=A0ABD2KYP5_9BILA
MASDSSLSPSISSKLFLINYQSDTLQRFKDKFSQTDWELLEKYLDDERKLGILKNNLFDKLNTAQLRWELQMNVQEKCQLIGEMEEYLYELQLVEHALKVPMLAIAKIIFSINPIRYLDRDTSQIKQKPVKKRKNELGGLVGEINDDLNKIPAREAKLLAVSQVHKHHQEEQFEELIAMGNDVPKRGRLKKRTVPTVNRPTKDGTETPKATEQHQAQDTNLMDLDEEKKRNVDEAEQREGAEVASSISQPIIAQMPALLSEESQKRGSTSSPQRAESSGNCSSELMHSPPRTRATKKKSRETDIGHGTNEPTRMANAKSPRKRRASVTEHQQNEGNEIDQMEIGEEETETERMDGQQKADEAAEPTYCLCEQVSFGEMICCDYELCSVEWFHFACVNIKSKPKGKKWFCPLCRFNDKANMLKPELLYKLDLARHRSQQMANHLDRKGIEYVSKRMPKIGVGTYQIHGNDIFEVIDAALEVGYRFIDTAQIYRNEKHIGDALTELLPKYGLKRLLKTDYVDLVLIHWPGTSRLKRENPRNAQLRAESWKAMEQMHGEGQLRAIGVSNFNVPHLEQLIGGGWAKVMPAVNQCECHPHWAQPQLIAFCARNGIHFQAYSSFGGESNRGELFRDTKVREMASKYDCSISDFLLAWALSQGMSVLPRSRSREHIRENFLGAGGIRVSAEDIEAVKAENGRKYCWDPDGVQ